MIHLVPFADPDPRVSGVLTAARAGNTDALRVAADRLRDADKPDDAYKLDFLAGELDQRRLQARHLRAVLAALPEPTRRNDPRAWTKMLQMREFLARTGLPVEPATLSASKGMPCAFLILAPTDGQQTAETAERLGTYLSRTFTDAMFFVFSANLPLTDAGRAAEAVAARLDAAEKPGAAA